MKTKAAGRFESLLEPGETLIGEFSLPFATNSRKYTTSRTESAGYNRKRRIRTKHHDVAKDHVYVGITERRCIRIGLAVRTTERHGIQLHMVLPGVVQSIPWCDVEDMVAGVKRDGHSPMLLGKVVPRLGGDILFRTYVFEEEDAARLTRLAAKVKGQALPCSPARKEMLEERSEKLKAVKRQVVEQTAKLRSGGMLPFMILLGVGATGGGGLGTLIGAWLLFDDLWRVLVNGGTFHIEGLVVFSFFTLIGVFGTVLGLFLCGSAARTVWAGSAARKALKDLGAQATSILDVPLDDVAEEAA